MEKNTQSSRSYLQFGLLLGILLILSFVVVYVLDIDLSESPAVGTVSSVINNVLLPVILIIVACNNFKKNNNGFISFGQCLKVGVSVAFIAGLIFALFNVIFNFIFPEYAEELLRQTRQIMLQQNPNMTEEQLEMGLSITKKFSSPLFSIPIILLMYSFLGLIYSLIIGAIVKKEQPQSHN